MGLGGGAGVVRRSRDVHASWAATACFCAVWTQLHYGGVMEACVAWLWLLTYASSGLLPWLSDCVSMAIPGCRAGDWGDSFLGVFWKAARIGTLSLGGVHRGERLRCGRGGVLPAATRAPVEGVPGGDAAGQLAIGASGINDYTTRRR